MQDGVLVGQPVHRSREDEVVRPHGDLARREVGRVDAGRHDVHGPRERAVEALQRERVGAGDRQHEVEAPDGLALDLGDRQQVAGAYRGIESAEPVLVVPEVIDVDAGGTGVIHVDAGGQ